MAEATLRAEVRTGRGRGCRNRLKRQGLVPAVLYGKGIGSIPIQVSAKAVKEILATQGKSSLLELTLVTDGKEERHHVVIKDLQYNQLKRELLHLDLHAVTLDEPVTITVPVRLTGTGVIERKGGVVEQFLREIEIAGWPGQLPEALEVDLSGRAIDDTIYVRDLTPPPGVSILEDLDTVVAAITPTAEEEGAAEAAAGDEA